MAQSRGQRMNRKKSYSDEQGHSAVQHLLSRKQGGKRRKRNPNERDCMARAFQLHLHKIVESTIVRESDLPDLLISNGYLTEEECSYVRERSNRKDQIRTLLVITRGRSLKNMKYLLEYIEKENKVLAQDINNCYKDLIDQGYRDKDCLRCKLNTHVDVKSVADRLHALDFIPGKLYNEIVLTEAPVGGQDKLWGKLIASLESNIYPKMAFNCFKACLSEKGHYDHLADDMEHFLTDGHRMIECICSVQSRPYLTHATSSDTSYSTDSVNTENADSTYSVELRSRFFETVSPRPKAAYFPSDCWMEEPTGEVELRQGRTRRQTSRPKATYILPQIEEGFLDKMEFFSNESNHTPILQ